MVGIAVRDATPGGECVEGVQDLSVLFLTTACHLPDHSCGAVGTGDPCHVSLSIKNTHAELAGADPRLLRKMPGLPQPIDTSRVFLSEGTLSDMDC